MTSTYTYFFKVNCNMTKVQWRFYDFKRGAGRQILWGGNANLMCPLENSFKQSDFLNSFYLPEHGTYNNYIEFNNIMMLQKNIESKICKSRRIISNSLSWGRMNRFFYRNYYYGDNWAPRVQQTFGNYLLHRCEYISLIIILLKNICTLYE